MEKIKCSRCGADVSEKEASKLGDDFYCANCIFRRIWFGKKGDK